MKLHVETWLSRIDALTLRERLLALGALAVVVYTLWNEALMAPLETQRLEREARIEQLRGEMAALGAEAAAFGAAQDVDPDRENRDRREALLAEIAALDAALRERTAQLIAPQSMARVLEEVLRNTRGLSLVSARSLDPEPIFDDDGEKSGTTSAAATRKDETPAVYRHAFQLEFQGGFPETVAYLRAIEALPWKFRWDALEYTVEEWPRARIVLTVSTLSLSEGWIGV